MAMSEEKIRRAGRYVEAAMGTKGWNRRDLAREASVDQGTVADFLDGTRWPQTATRAKLERALGMESGDIAAAAEGMTTVRPAAQDDAYVSRGRSRTQPDDDEAALAAKLAERQRLDSEIADLVARLHRRG